MNAGASGGTSSLQTWLAKEMRLQLRNILFQWRRGEGGGIFYISFYIPSLEILLTSKYIKEKNAASSCCCCLLATFRAAPAAAGVAFLLDATTCAFGSILFPLPVAPFLLTGRSEKLKGFELPAAVYLDPTPFSVEADLMTPKMSLKRPQLLKYYKDKIDAMYATLP
jgi:hypothetical protein